jgi:hypothetical protein
MIALSMIFASPVAMKPAASDGVLDRPLAS